MSDTGLRLLKNALYLLIGVIIANIGSFIFRILIAQEYGSSGFGLLSIGLMVIGIATTISLLGLPDGMVNFVPRFRENESYDRIVGTVTTGISISLGVSILFTVCLIFASSIIANDIFGTSNLTEIIIWMSLIVPANILIRLSSGVALGFEHGGYRTFIRQSFPKTILLVGAIIAILLGLPITDIGKVYALSMWCAAVVGIGIVIKIVPIHKANSITSNSRELIYFSVPLMFASTAGLFFNWVDTAIVGIYLTESKVGIYQSAFLIANHVGIFLGAIAGSLYPNFSSLLENGSYGQIKQRHSQGRRWGFLSSIAPITYLLFFPEASLQFIFGSEFGQGSNPLRIILVGQFVYVFTGPITNLLKSLEKSRFIFITYVISGVINLILNLLLVPYYGIIGAAIGTSVGVVIIYALHYYKTNRRVGLELFDRDLMIASGAAVIAGLLSLIVAPYINTLFRFLSHICLFTIVYISILFILGTIDEGDVNYIYSILTD